MRPTKRMHLGLALLATLAIVCACTAPSGESKNQQGQAAAPEAPVGADAALASPTTQDAASGQPGLATVATALPTDAPAVADPATARDPDGESADDADIDEQIQSLLGDAKSYREVFDRLQQAVKADDRKAVAALVDYPLAIREKGKAKKTIRNADAFVAQWDVIMTAQVRQVVLDQKYAGLFVNQYGAMLGSGQIWINGICEDNKCVKSNVRISAVNPDAPPAAP